MFAVDDYERQKVLPLTRRRAERTASDQSLDFFCPSIRRLFASYITIIVGFPDQDHTQSLNRRE